MEITLLAFAQAKDDFGFSSQTVACSAEETLRELVRRIAPNANLEHLRIAVDCEFAEWDTPIGNAREVALIPPVSGG
ncbi:MoaD/ThiS family protein [Luteolibacter pohnpeiensis]|uniref:MoaD/ThiS family protein n=1 Tax=Luteolibacter pohnpeiensis TaxID=454153 RepID=A0A934VY63_9BACT|nr:MoaD/ThiS family protein [Luteolibacter pohnpeiensis]MBK1884224.1 MoaD/ThiS family protein [Luteolibacter pohnpeiensis]